MTGTAYPPTIITIYAHYNKKMNTDDNRKEQERDEDEQDKH